MSYEKMLGMGTNGEEAEEVIPTPRIKPGSTAPAPVLRERALPPIPVRCGEPINIGTTDPRLMTTDEIEQENIYLLGYRSQCYDRSSPIPQDLNETLETRRSALLDAKREREKFDRLMKMYALATVPGALIGAYAGHRSGKGVAIGAAVGAWANLVTLAAPFMIFGMIFGRY